ncbi:hypothetical protein N7454_011251 [Penicillium verhagenii]|nr:hypothetical protein N7454_011251 [Penicillium verhagenii]
MFFSINSHGNDIPRLPALAKRALCFTVRLRRRLSRDSKSLSDIRECKRFLLPFSRKPSRSAFSKPGPDPTDLGYYGNSLTSERGYDSDAQYITTPRRDPLGRFPASRGFRRPELSDLIEQSQERSEAERWAVSNGQTVTDSQESAFGMHFIPTPPGSLRGPPSTFHTARDTDESKYQPSTPSPLRLERSQGSSGMKMKFGRSLPSLSSTNEPGTQHFEQSSVLNVPENSSGRDLMSEWKQFMKTSRDKYGMGSSGSIPTPSADLVVPKMRRPSNSARSFTDPHSLHLSELGISNRLMTHSQSSQVATCNPSITELVQRNRSGFGNFSQENVKSLQSGGSTISANDTPNNPNGQRDASSCYSQASPSSGTLSIGGLSLKKFTNKSIDSKPAMQEISKTGSEVLNVPAPRNTLLSRFQEHCDSGSSDSPQFQNHANGLVSLRKVSVGWMSGGRRVGYGYSAVPGKDGGSPKKDNQSHPQVCQVPDLKADLTTVDGVHDSPPSHHRLEKIAQLSPSPSHPRPPLYDAFTGPRSIKPTKSNAVLPHFREIMNRSSHEHNPFSSSTEGSSRVLCAPELTPTVQTEYCQVPQSSHYTNKGAGNDTIARQWARMTRSVNTKPRTYTYKPGLDGMTHSEMLQKGLFSVDRSDETEAEYLDAENQDDQANVPEHNNFRASRWVSKFSRYRESRRPTVRQQEPSHSQSSSGGYQDCDSASISLKQDTSTRAYAIDDLDDLEMPGSFEGSRWASRISRML